MNYSEEKFFSFFKKIILLLFILPAMTKHTSGSAENWVGPVKMPVGQKEKEKEFIVVIVFDNTNTNIILPQTIDMKNQQPLMKQTTIKYYYYYYYYLFQKK